MDVRAVAAPRPAVDAGPDTLAVGADHVLWQPIEGAADELVARIGQLA